MWYINSEELRKPTGFGTVHGDNDRGKEGQGVRDGDEVEETTGGHIMYL